jgi:peptidoglycan/xylan/chitin deacetylase (PgdA/CDA1 family)
MTALSPARLGLWAYAVSGVALGTSAALGARPPLVPTLLAFGGYLAFGTVGVFWPERGMYGDPLSRGPTAARELALTFDDGPSPSTTPRVLEQLARAGAHATFFVVGKKALAHPELVREIVRAGHQIGLHGFEHDRLFSLWPSPRVARDIERTQAALASIGVARAELFRPPIGFVSHLTARGARLAGVTLVGCSARAFDGFRGADPHKVGARLIRAASPGAILALHDAAEHDDYVPASVEALPQLLTALRELKLETVTLARWTDSQRSQPKPGAPSTKLWA